MSLKSTLIYFTLIIFVIIIIEKLKKEERKHKTSYVGYNSQSQSLEIFPKPNFDRLLRSMTLSIVPNIFQSVHSGVSGKGSNQRKPNFYDSGQTSPFSVQTVDGHNNFCTTVQLLFLDYCHYLPIEKLFCFRITKILLMLV